MTQFEPLNNDNYILYAMKHYTNPSCTGIEEFYEDMNRVKYLKKLFQVYSTNGVLKERLILNHIIILQNVLGVDCCARVLFLRIPEISHPVLKTFLVFLNAVPHSAIPEADIKTIPLDEEVVAVLRAIGNS